MVSFLLCFQTTHIANANLTPRTTGVPQSPRGDTCVSNFSSSCSPKTTTSYYIFCKVPILVHICTAEASTNAKFREYCTKKYVLQGSLALLVLKFLTSSSWPASSCPISKTSFNFVLLAPLFQVIIDALFIDALSN